MGKKNRRRRKKKGGGASTSAKDAKDPNASNQPSLADDDECLISKNKYLDTYTVSIEAHSMMRHPVCAFSGKYGIRVCKLVFFIAKIRRPRIAPAAPRSPRGTAPRALELIGCSCYVGLEEIRPVEISTAA